jgi:hypothetical protein
LYDPRSSSLEVPEVHGRLALPLTPALRRGAILAAAAPALAAACLASAAPASAGQCVGFTVSSDAQMALDSANTFIAGATWCAGSPPLSIGTPPQVARVSFTSAPSVFSDVAYRAADGGVVINVQANSGGVGLECAPTSSRYTCSAGDDAVEVKRLSADREAPAVDVGLPGAPAERAALAGGLPVLLRSSEAGTVRATLRAATGSPVHGGAVATQRRGGARTILRLRLTAAGRAAIAPAGGSRHRLEVRVTDRAGNTRTVRRTVLVR